MTSPRLLFYVTFLILGAFAQTTAPKQNSSVRQERKKTGENLTLQCFCKMFSSEGVFWYKQTLGQELKLLSTFFKYGNYHFHDDFKKNPRFSLDTGDDKNHLTITDLQMSDSATYYCIGTYARSITILESVTVDVTGAGLHFPILVQQSGSETFQPGGNVTLNCTVKTRTCDGEHNVYWLKDVEESQPGLIYTNKSRNDQCEKEPQSETNTCVFNLPMKNLDRSHTGTYYCAVVSCGRILFGKGTKLDFEDKRRSVVLVYVFGGALTVMTILVVVLSFFLYKTKNRISLLSQGASSTSNEGHRDAENLFYAALDINRPNTSRRQRDIMTKSECVYSRVRQ